MRNDRIDLLRFIGLVMIILAHVHPPSVLSQLRNFDVPLMVMVSGMSFGLTFRGHSPYPGYVWKRIKRIIFPLWIFLTGYFSILWLVEPESPELKAALISDSYFLIGDIEYFWIMRVFFFVALLAPFIFQMNEKIRSDIRFFIYLGLGCILLEIIRFYSVPYAGTMAGDAFILSFFHAYAYSLLFALGLRLLNLKGRVKIFSLFVASVIIFFGMLFYLWGLEGKFLTTKAFKYPPSMYYFSYSVAVTVFLWMIGDRLCKLVQTSRPLTDFVVFVSRNSMWIYLWHVPCIKLIHTHYALKFIAVLSIATFLTFIQSWLVSRVIAPRVPGVKLRRNLENLLVG